jgi:hypothetical protein
VLYPTLADLRRELHTVARDNPAVAADFVFVLATMVAMAVAGDDDPAPFIDDLVHAMLDRAGRRAA